MFIAVTCEDVSLQVQSRESIIYFPVRLGSFSVEIISVSRLLRTFQKAICFDDDKNNILGKLPHIKTAAVLDLAKILFVCAFYCLMVN